MPNAEKFLKQYNTYNDFIKVIATKLLEIEENEIYRTIQQTGQEGLIQLWTKLPNSIFLDAVLETLNCSLRVYHLDFVKDSVIVNDTFFGKRSTDSFIINALHYMYPVEHFNLLLPDSIVVNNHMV